MNFELLLLPSLAGLLVLLMIVPLGRIVVDQGIVFVDLAIAAVAGIGALAAQFAGYSDIWVLRAAATAAALLAGLLLAWCHGRFPASRQAAVGAVFALASAAGLLLLDQQPQADVHPFALLIGDLLWTTPQMLWPAAVVTLCVLTGLIAGQLRLAADSVAARLLFFLLLALAVSSAVQIAGVLLVFASLVLPALAVRGAGAAAGITLALLVGIAGFAGGLLGSMYIDLPAAGLIVACLGAAALLCGGLRALIAPSRDAAG
jgi:zinc/manganese transport system permease protein